MPNEPTIGDLTQIFVSDETFRCRCGANVFVASNIYTCNVCRTAYKIREADDV